MSGFTGLPQVDALLEKAEETINEQGHRTRKAFLDADRYLFDFNLDGEWEQFDTEDDAAYFGVWLNKAKLRTLAYIEGDLIFTQCVDAAGYDAKISALCAFHQAAPAFVGIKPASVTKYYQDRSALYINPPASSESES